MLILGMGCEEKIIKLKSKLAMKIIYNEKGVEMRFLIEFKDFKSKELENVSLRLLDTFLNEHLIGKFHGHFYECILVRFINNPPTSKKLKLKVLYKTIAEVELSGTFMNNNQLNIEDFQSGLEKIEEAIKNVYSIEAKEPLDYHGEELLADFKECKSFAPISFEELNKYAKNQQNIKFQNRSKRSDCLMYSYSINPQQLTKKIVGIRVYDQFVDGTLVPYNYIYSELFSNLLRRSEVKLPNYDEIYINIGETMEQAKQELALETWHKYTYATLNLSTYLSSDEETKSKMLLECISNGLRLIADFDHLEKEKIEKIIQYIKENGVNIELIYTSKQNNNFLAEIIYKVPQSHLSKAEYKLRLTDLKNGKSGEAHIDFIHTYWAPYSFGNILIKKEEILIKGRGSLRAEISRQRDKLPDEYIFKIGDIIK
ncbi:hypothetical protein [Bacillus cihuensis]|uniref:hypothetical protein n=1 Tax=Bacillus cihuensis TaxID=1208599 RepID=UPI001F299DF1|nr:hypothetical protein [Bacillus cihuensis]